MKENWINDMRRKLENHQMDPPPGLWDDICKQMGLSPEPVRKPATTKRLYWAAAAAVLALVGFFVFQNGNDSEQPQQANAVSQQSVSGQSPSQQPVSQQLAETSPMEQESQAKAPLLALARHQAPDVKGETETKEEVLPESDSSAETLQTPDESKQTFADSHQTPDESQETSAEPQQTESFALRTESLDNLPIAESNDVQTPNKWSLGLNASGGLLAHNNNSTDDIHSQEKQYEALNGEYNAKYVPKHHLPVRFGLSVQYQLSNCLALHSGISYTYLYSEFDDTYYGNSYDQKLHYLGIPLGMTWQLWSARQFRFYLSAGAMLEKCVRTNLEGSEKPWQWSVDGAAGVEYGFTRQFGFYLEPSLGYYFDDGTALEHYYKKHPFAPSIEFGLRLHLNE